MKVKNNNKKSFEPSVGVRIAAQHPRQAAPKNIPTSNPSGVGLVHE
jgi:hypothetical protein